MYKVSDMDSSTFPGLSIVAVPGKSVLNGTEKNPVFCGGGGGGFGRVERV